MKIINALSYLLLVVLVSLAVVMAGPVLLGWQNLAVLTGSMEPTIPVGGMVTVNPKVSPEDIRPGDIITFTVADGEANTTHRVTEILPQDRAFITKGDANNTVDIAPISYDRLVGKVELYVPLLGYLIGIMQSQTGIWVVAGVLIAAVLIMLLPMVFRPEQEPRREYL